MQRYWVVIAIVLTALTLGMGWASVRAFRDAPPLPDRVISTYGDVVIPRGAIRRGRGIWERLEARDLGSTWGRGGPGRVDWTSEWLHREITSVLDAWATERYLRPFDRLPASEQATLLNELVEVTRRNSYDPRGRTIAVSPVRARAIAATTRFIDEAFSRGYPARGVPPDAVRDAAQRRDLAAYFFWTAWASSTNRPGTTTSYTGNLPREPLIGNAPAAGAVTSAAATSPEWPAAGSLVAFVLLATFGLWRAMNRP